MARGTCFWTINIKKTTFINNTKSFSIGNRFDIQKSIEREGVSEDYLGTQGQTQRQRQREGERQREIERKRKRQR